DPQSLAPQGWYWDSPPSTPDRFAYINPASSVYRKLFVARLRGVVAAIKPDALHLDLSGAVFNDGNGRIDRMTYPQGAVQLHKDIIAAFPNLALDGEGMNDVLYAYNSFAQNAWDADIVVPAIPGTTTVGNNSPPGHPINTFLWNGQPQGGVLYYGH